MSGSSSAVSFDELAQLHDVFLPLLTPDGPSNGNAKELLQCISEWLAGNQSAAERLQTRGPEVSGLIERVCQGDDVALIARRKTAVQRFCSAKLDEMDAEERSRQCGYFLALGAGEIASPQTPPRSSGPAANGSAAAPAAGTDGSSTAGDVNNGASGAGRVSDLDVRALFEQLLSTETLGDVPMSHIVEIAVRASDLFKRERNIVTVDFPCVAVGDIHGQFQDLKQNILKNGGEIGQTRYIFLGDYVDRGEDSVLSVAFLLAAKIIFPDNIFMIRGNHESRQTNCIYGFLAECRKRFPATAPTEGGSPGASGSRAAGGTPLFANEYLSYLGGDHPLWSAFNEVFDKLPVAAILGSRIFCVHGGLSPDAETLDQILAVKRATDIDEGVLADLTWSDPSGAEGYHFNSRGCGHLFGEDVTKRFIETNGFDLVLRAHQCVKKGYQFDHNDRLLTLFSAPNYCGQGNDGAIAKIDADGKIEFVQFQAAPRNASPTSPNGGRQFGDLPIYFQQAPPSQSWSVSGGPVGGEAGKGM